MTLGNTDLRRIKDVPNGLDKELALPAAALEVGSRREQKGTGDC